jgi:hypothetical protein
MPDLPATVPTNRIPTPEGWARADHTHDAPQMPRWVRYLAWVLAALTALVIVLSVLVGRNQQVLDDLERRLDTMCDVLTHLPQDTADALALHDQLECPAPPAG